MSYFGKYLEAETLKGSTITAISSEGLDIIKINTDDGKRYAFFHNQDCCERVAIHDIEGNLSALIGSPLIVAQKDSLNSWPKDVAKPEYEPESFTWTVLTLATDTAKVRVRWFGYSNGYYGEGIDLEEMP